MPERTPCADNHNQGIHGTDELKILLPHNPGGYLPKMKTAQEQALITEKFRQNQAPFRKYTAVDGAIKTDNHSRGTILPLPTGGRSDMIWTGVSSHHATEYIHKIQGHR